MTPKDSVATAQTLYLQGRSVEAEGVFREVLRAHPDSPEALEGLGVLVYQQGRTAEAAELFVRALAIQTDSARLHANLGEALRLLKRPGEALEHIRAATELDPTLAQAWNSQGLLAVDQGRHSDAEAAFREALRLRPKFVPAHINLANAQLALGQPGRAADALRAALRIAPNNALALTNLGRTLAQQRAPALLDEAETLCRRAVAVAPGLAHAINNLADVLRIRGKLDEAIEWQRKGRQPPRAPAGPPSARDQRGGWTEHGVAASDSSARSETAAGRHALGLLLLKEAKHDDAETYFQEALRIDPTLAASWIGLARVAEERGDFEPACARARQALLINPKQAEAYWRMAFILRRRLPDADFAAMTRLIEDPELAIDARAILRFGLAAVLDDKGIHTEAAAHLEVANALQSASKAQRGLVYDPDHLSTFVDRIIATFTADFVARGRGWGSSDPRPVFVVGLPRSGTTLIEQVLASHPQVHGAGELFDVNRIFRALPELAGQASGDPFVALKQLGPELALAAAKRYIDRVDLLAPAGAARFVDKEPDNLNHLGLIAVLWPNAHVILCRRDLRDVAVSCWQTGLLTTPWSNDWDHIARRFADHQRIVRHWRQTRPIEWLDVAYEDLVADVECQARRMTEFLGLEWDPACLEFHANRRVVRTPSLVQVRQPVHSGSVGRWRHYEAFIEPLLSAFERHAVELQPPSGKVKSGPTLLPSDS
jgi:tetratricopeptide (TPR) repeat protein